MYSNPNPPPPQPPQQQYPQAPPYQPAQQQPVYVTQQPGFVQLPPAWGMNPQACVCPNCRNQVVTRIVHEPGLATWLAVGGLVLIGCWLGCCLIPLCVDAGKDVKHYCPNCNNLLGAKAVIS